MPTDTFYRLPEEKRERLVCAIYQELSRVPVTEMSINRIVHQAGISRGSFYQYFTDRDDLVDFLIGNFLNRIQAFTAAEAASCTDCFVLMRRIIREIRRFGDLPENRAFAANLLSHIRSGWSLRSGCIHKTHIGQAVMVDWYDRYFDRAALNADTDETFSLILELLFTVFRSAVAELYAPNVDTDRVIDRFDRKLEILQRGMLRAAGR